MAKIQPRWKKKYLADFWIIEAFDLTWRPSSPQRGLKA
jgi:hypothetical protein